MAVWDVDDLGSVAMKVSWTIFGVAFFTFGLRLYSRLKYIPRLGGGLYVDDFITLFCLLVIMTFCILLTISTRFGVGKHYDTLSPIHKVEALKWNLILNTLTPWMCTLPKFAIITTLKRILNYGTKTTIFLWGLALTSQASVLAMSLLGVFQCSPVAYQWDSSIKGGSCSGPSSYLGLAYFTYAYSTALDVFFALYPVPHVMRLNMPLKTRISVSVSLSISWVGFGISIYKFSIFSRLGQIMAVDPTFPLVYLCMTHAAEGSTLIIATSLATLRPLLRGIKARVNDMSGITKASANRQSRVSKLAGMNFVNHNTNQSQVHCIASTRRSVEDTVFEERPSSTEMESDIFVRKTIDVSIAEMDSESKLHT